MTLFSHRFHFYFYLYSLFTIATLRFVIGSLLIKALLTYSLFTVMLVILELVKF